MKSKELFNKLKKKQENGKFLKVFSSAFNRVRKKGKYNSKKTKSIYCIKEYKIFHDFQHRF